MLLAAISNAMQAQMYDYYRHSLRDGRREGRVPGRTIRRRIESRWIGWLYRCYLLGQRRLSVCTGRWSHVLATRSNAGVVREEDRTRYRECFYWPVRGWNLLGDNTRFYAIGVWRACTESIYFSFILVPMNLALVVLWLWQRNADRKISRQAVIDWIFFR